jgi:HemX protein
MNGVMAATNVALPVLYLAAFGLYVWVFRTDAATPRFLATRFTTLVALFHLAVELVRAVAYGRLPMGSPPEFTSALALALLVTYLAGEQRWKVKTTGFLPVGIAFILQFVASAFATLEPQDRPFLSDPGYAGHAVLALLAYTALTLSFVYALLYLVLARQLGRRQFGLLFRRLPPLDTLERMSVGAVELGVPLLFASLVLGHLWMSSLTDRVTPALAAQLSPYDPKILASWVILVGYLCGLIGHRFFGWRGRRMNVIAVTAFVVIVLAMGAVRHFVPSFHDFRDRPAAAARPTPGGAADGSAAPQGGAS